MAEKETTSRIEKQLAELGHTYVNIHGSSFGRAGVSDYIAIVDGTAYAIEAKDWGGKVYPNQFDFLEEVLVSKGKAIIAYPDVELTDCFQGHVPKVVYEHNEMNYPKETCLLVLPDNYQPKVKSKEEVDNGKGTNGWAEYLSLD